MTRAERIEAAAKELARVLEHPVAAFRIAALGDAHSGLKHALALPPDAAPRRLTVEDMKVIYELYQDAPFEAQADYLNARIFGGSNDDAP